MEKRDWKKIWLYGFITGGLYNWYVIYAMQNELGVMERQTKQNSMNLVFFYLLSFTTGSLYAFFVAYTYQRRALALAKAYGIDLWVKSPFIFALIVMYVPIFSYILMISNHNKLIDSYESGYAYREKLN